MRRLSLFFITAAACVAANKPVFESELISPLDVKHNHASCIVELGNGDLLACWYRGSGERTADDVQVMGARTRKGTSQWTTPFVLVDTLGVSRYESRNVRR